MVFLGQLLLSGGRSRSFGKCFLSVGEAGIDGVSDNRARVVLSGMVKLMLLCLLVVRMRDQGCVECQPPSSERSQYTSCSLGQERGDSAEVVHASVQLKPILLAVLLVGDRGELWRYRESQDLCDSKGTLWVGINFSILLNYYVLMIWGAWCKEES
jgi:hypothetical protein